MPPRSCPGLSTPGERRERHLQSWTTIIASRDDRSPLNIPCHPNVERQPIIADSRTLHIAAPNTSRGHRTCTAKRHQVQCQRPSSYSKESQAILIYKSREPTPKGKPSSRVRPLHKFSSRTPQVGNQSGGRISSSSAIRYNFHALSPSWKSPRLSAAAEIPPRNQAP